MNPAVCLYFQVHQPYRLRPLDFFSIGEHEEYENGKLNEEVLGKVTANCYLPALELFGKLGRKHDGRFRLALSLSGIVLEQLERSHPGVIARLADLVDAGTVELLAETHDHSLAFLFSRREFRRQVARHRETARRLFGVTTRVFRNTELLYTNDLAGELVELGFQGCLAEGVTWLSGGGSANQLRRARGGNGLPLLLRNRRLSDDLAFRFGDPRWREYPLRPGKFLRWLAAEPGEVVNLFMDLEALGEHLQQGTGVFEFWEEWINLAVAGGVRFATPGELVAGAPPTAVYDCPGMTSWADRECDESAWLGNTMQKEAAGKVYSLEEQVRARQDPGLLRAFGHLQTSDHFHYMSTKVGTDGAVHGYFNPYSNPYDYYLHYMNALADFQILLADVQPPARERGEVAMGGLTK